MPLSNDNQDYGKSDEKNKDNERFTADHKDELTSDDFKGKKIDADLTQEQDRPLEEK